MYIKFKIIVYRAKIQKNAQNTKNLQYLLIRYATLRNVQRKNCVFFFVIPFACSIFVKNKNITSWKYA